MERAMTRWEWFFCGCLAILGLLIIEGCATVKTVYDACREGLCR
jgi:hypothetical protein